MFVQFRNHDHACSDIHMCRLVYPVGSSGLLLGAIVYHLTFSHKTLASQRSWTPSQLECIVKSTPPHLSLPLPPLFFALQTGNAPVLHQLRLPVLDDVVPQRVHLSCLDFAQVLHARDPLRRPFS